VLLLCSLVDCYTGARKPAPAGRFERDSPTLVSGHATAAPKMKPPTCAKNATPPPFAWAPRPEVRLEELVEEPEPEENRRKAARG